ncbi:caprin-1-like isoform X2 [Conger conger]|uniref:caprin-1-like isoform X2 n=1 Tax=Conger conger TaxID=82655 RepID=UPI002A5A1338|nr:caprin-1-like isoform X2 [Conger conger]
MPSATIGNRTVQSSSPDVGSAPGSIGQITMTSQSSGAQTEAMKQVLGVIDKKVRNMEKKKGKLDDYQAKKNKGERLNQDQLDALSKFQEVANNLEFARELQKSFLALGQDIQKAVKKSARREQLQREEAEQRRLKTVLELQFLLDRLGEDGVRQELKQAGEASALLSDTDLSALDEFYKLVGPEPDPNTRLTEQFEQASLHYWDLLEGKDKAVAGTTYKSLKETLDKVLQSGYFERTHTHQNGVCQEEEEEEEEEVEEEGGRQSGVAESEPEERPTEPEGEVPEDYLEPIEVEATEFVNRQFIPEASYSNSDKEQDDDWSAQSEVASGVPQQQPAPLQSAPPPVTPEPMELNSVTPVPAPVPTPDPVVRKQAVQDLMEQMQGPYNFMQDSMLEFDGQALDPAIVSAQPMKPAPNMDHAQMVCPPGHAESRLTQPPPVPVQPEPTQASMALSSEQPPSSSQPPAFQPVSKPLHSSGINVNAAPFQSMQTVFNLNAPVPPANEADSLKQPGQYQSNYGQGFSGQTQHAVEQPDMQPEQLQAVVGAFHTQDQTIPASGGHQAVSPQPQQQGTAFGRPGQSFYNSRAVSRGGPRNARGMINGYRGASNGFRGGYDGYRPPFPNTPNSGYGQAQFNTPRDYSGSSYQRDGYQQNYKRGAGQGPRGCSRGNAQAMRS